MSARWSPRGAYLSHRWPAVLAALLLGALALAACGPASMPRPEAGVIQAIGAESEYANVLAQLGGKYVQVTSILNNPSSDPHTFEASTSVAEEAGQAQLIVQNGADYDSFMNLLEGASPSSGRKVLVVQSLLGVPTDTSNPHFWYDPTAMPKVARAITAGLESLEPARASYFQANLTAFLTSLKPWFASIERFKAKYDHTTVAVTEPVADSLLAAMGMRIETPVVFQDDVMNGVDPSPEDIALQDGLLSRHAVTVFCYNEQVVSALTGAIRQTAISAGVPIVAVYETMPTPGYDFQTWMLAEVDAIESAVKDGVSTQHL